jgi:hypothetical protein
MLLLFAANGITTVLSLRATAGRVAISDSSFSFTKLRMTLESVILNEAKNLNLFIAVNNIC